MSGLDQMPDRRRVADGAYDLLRRAIFNSELRSGQRLSVPALADQLGVSRSPVREAVLRLVRDGLAREEPHRGAVVISLGRHELIRIYEVREVLEGLAGRLAAERLTPTVEEELRATLVEHERAVATHDMEAHIVKDMRFHELVRQVAGNADLSTYLDQLQGKVRVAMQSTCVTAGTAAALRDHWAIFDALVAGDVDGAEGAARNHIARLRVAFAQGLGQPQGTAREGRRDADPHRGCAGADPVRAD